jgi:hypothetical protein
MRTLLGERFAPITERIGFLERGLDECVDALQRWRQNLGRDVELEILTAGFPECLHSLEPLVGGARPRELFVQVSKDWTAYFDCSIRGTDADSTIPYLTRTIGCRGLAICAAPHTIGLSGVDVERMGSIQFALYGPVQTDFLNYVRTVSASFDGGRWRFDTWGTEQAFEETSEYRTRRVRDRFTSDMLGRYCQALGLDVFNPQSYGPRATLVRSQVVIPSEGKVMSIEETQRWLGITPNLADSLPG